MSRPEPRCATPYLYSGELRVRPEVEGALAELKDRLYAAVPSWRKDGRWELWTVEGDGVELPCIISGPNSTFPSREAALAAGAAWLAAQGRL